MRYQGRAGRCEAVNRATVAGVATIVTILPPAFPVLGLSAFPVLGLSGKRGMMSTNHRGTGAAR